MCLHLIQSVKLLFSLLIEINWACTGTNVWTHKRGPGLWTLEWLDSEECRIPEFRTHAVKSSCVRGKEERGGRVQMELMVNVTSCWHFSWIAWLVLTQERVQVSSKLCKTWRHGSNLPLLHRGCWLDMYYGQNHLPKRNPWSGRTMSDLLNLSSSLLLIWLCNC